MSINPHLEIMQVTTPTLLGIDRSPNTVYVLESFQLNRAHEGEFISKSAFQYQQIAYVRMKDANNIEVEKSIVYHAGMKSWALQTEQSEAQMKTAFDTGNLNYVISLFEDHCKCALPPIELKIPGAGVYLATSKEVALVSNPWPLEPGQTYEVQMKSRIKRFIPRIDSLGCIRIAFDDPGNFISAENSLETVDPQTWFDSDAWNSIHKISPKMNNINQSIVSNPRPRI